MKAFPWHEGFEKEAGMDLRDYFAAKAMQSLILVLHKREDNPEDGAYLDVHKFAYLYADLMMEAREE